MSFQLKRLLKVFVNGLQRLLPRAWFDAFYDFAFPKYKGLIRFLYLVRGFLLYRFPNAEKWRMVRKIHDIMPYTLVGIGGLEATYRAAKDLDRRCLEGDFIELGVARGGCAALMGRTIFDVDEAPQVARKLWLFDSYEGLPDPTEEDFDTSRGSGTGEHVRPLPKGSCLGTLDEVKKLMLVERGFPQEKIEFVKGWFQDTVPAQRDRIGKVALLRIDGDWYESTKVCLEGLFDQVVPGGVIIIDDYQSCYGCERAVDEFIGTNQLEVEIHLDGRGGCYFYKPQQPEAKATRSAA